MNVLRRFLLCIWSLILIAAAAVIGVCAFREDVVDYWLRKLGIVFKSGDFFWPLILCAAAVLVLGILGVYVALARKSAPTQVVIGASEGGQVNISLSAVDHVVQKAAQTIADVREVRTQIKAMRDGVEVSLHLTMPHEVNVPETAAAVQSAVKTQLEGMTGLHVTEVKVLIANVADAPNLPAKTI